MAGLHDGKYYVIWDRIGTNYNINGKSLTYEFDGQPVEELTFNLTYTKFGLVWVSGKIKVSAVNAEGKNVDLGEYGRTDSPVSVTLQKDYKSIRIYHNDGLTGTKYISDIKVTRATTFDSPKTHTFNAQLNETTQQTISIPYNSTVPNQKLTATCSNTKFKFNQDSWTLGETGPLDLGFTYTGNNLGNDTGTFILSRAGKKVASIEVTANVVGQYTPNITFNLKSAYTNHVYDLSNGSRYFNTDSPCDYKITVAKGDENKAVIIDNKLFVLDQEDGSTFSVIVDQQGNNTDWYGKKETHTISVTNGNSTTYCDPEGTGANLEIGYGGEATIDIPGPIYQVKYYAKVEWWVVGSYSVSVSDDGTNWTDVQTDINPNSSDKSKEHNINPTMRKLRFKRSSLADGTLYINDIRFSMLSYMNTNVGDLAFPETMIDAEFTEDATIEWSDVENAASNLAVLLDDNASSAFSTVSFNHNPNKAWAESQGIDARWGTSTLKLKYAPKTEGEHEGFVYIHDNIRFTRIKVTGTAYSNHLQLQPTVDLSTQRTELEYPYVTLNRTLNEGYSTLTLPFDTNINELSGYAVGDFVAQLSLVTYNAADGYTLFFKKVAEGVISAHQPYVIYRTAAITTYPQWINCHVEAPQTSTVSGTTDLKGWEMIGNYTPGLSMSGKYGIANGKLALGGASSTLNAYTAYFEPPTNAQNIRTRVAIMDDDGNATYIGEIRDGRLVPEAIYGADGIPQTELKNGINIVRTKDGRVRKIWKR